MNYYLRIRGNVSSCRRRPEAKAVVLNKNMWILEMSMLFQIHTISPKMCCHVFVCCHEKYNFFARGQYIVLLCLVWSRINYFRINYFGISYYRIAPSIWEKKKSTLQFLTLSATNLQKQKCNVTMLGLLFWPIPFRRLILLFLVSIIFYIKRKKKIGEWNIQL